jgi:hypothetical protein
MIKAIGIKMSHARLFPLWNPHSGQAAFLQGTSGFESKKRQHPNSLADRSREFWVWRIFRMGRAMAPGSGSAAPNRPDQLDCILDWPDATYEPLVA